MEIMVKPLVIVSISSYLLRQIFHFRGENLVILFLAVTRKVISVLNCSDSIQWSVILLFCMIHAGKGIIPTSLQGYDNVKKLFCFSHGLVPYLNTEGGAGLGIFITGGKRINVRIFNKKIKIKIKIKKKGCKLLSPPPGFAPVLTSVAKTSNSTNHEAGLGEKVDEIQMS